MVTKPEQLPLCPIPVASDEITVMRAGKHIGVLVWRFPNGDSIVRTEEACWIVPAAGMKVLEVVKL